MAATRDNKRMGVQKWRPLFRLRLAEWLGVVLLAFTWSISDVAGSYSQQSESRTAYACEDNKLVLECQRGEVIRILRANYGRFSLSVCNLHGQTEGWNLQCMSSNSKDIISERCDGRRQCGMSVNNHVFGDPCPSTSKYAEVKYLCQLAPSETPHNNPTTTTMKPLPPRMPLNGSPRPPQITSLKAISPTEIEVKWTQEEPANPILTTVIYYRDPVMELGPVGIYTSAENEKVIRDLRPNTTYSIFLKSFNIHGPSVSSMEASVKTPEASTSVERPIPNTTTTKTPLNQIRTNTAKASPLKTSTLPSITKSIVPRVSEPVVNLVNKNNLFITPIPTLVATFITTTKEIPKAAKSVKASKQGGGDSKMSVFIRVGTSSQEKENGNEHSSGDLKESILNSHDSNGKSQPHNETRSRLPYETETSVTGSSAEKFTSSFLENLDSETVPDSEPVQDKDLSQQIVVAESPTLEEESSEGIRLELDVKSSSDKTNEKLQYGKGSELLPSSSSISKGQPSTTNGIKFLSGCPSSTCGVDKSLTPEPTSSSQAIMISKETAVSTNSVERLKDKSTPNTVSDQLLVSSAASVKSGQLFYPMHYPFHKHYHGQKYRSRFQNPDLPSVPITTLSMLSTVKRLSAEQPEKLKAISTMASTRLPPEIPVNFPPSTIKLASTTLSYKLTGSYPSSTKMETHNHGGTPIDFDLYPNTGTSAQVTRKTTTTTTTTTTTSTTTSTSSTPPATTTKKPVRPDPSLPHVRPTEENPEDPDASSSKGNSDKIIGVVNKFCEEKEHQGVLWPKTRYGRIAEEICPENLRGMSTWRCLGQGWERSGPDLSDCISPWLEDLDTQINNVMRGEEPADEAAVDLSESMGRSGMTSGDLKRTATKLLPKLVQGLQRDDPHLSKPVKKRKMEKFRKAFMKTTSSLLSKDKTQEWRSLSKRDRRRAATSMVLAVENTGFEAASMMDVGSKDVSVDSNIVMEINVVDTQQAHSDLTFPSKKDMMRTPWEEETDSITISSTSLKIAGMRGPINIVFTLYKNMEELVQPQWNTISSVPVRSPSTSAEAYYNAGTIRDNNIDAPVKTPVMVINTKVIAASINSTKAKRQLPEPVRFTLHHLEPTNEAVPVCSFWDIDTSTLSGSWSRDGCRVLDTNNTHTTCECDHLTSFAVLMDVSGIKLSEEHELALRVITYVGCVISIICLMLSWITFMVFKNLQCDRNTIHKNLVLCLLLAEIVFLGGIAQTEPKLLCSIIAGLLHYLFLAAFAWMCLEGVQLYVMLVEVFEQEKSRVKLYYLFGYGVPLLIVAISAGVYHQGYGTYRHCWLTTENYFIWSFVGPALAVMLINIGMLSIAIYTMCRHSNMSATMKERSKVTKFSVTESLSSMETFASPKLRFPELPAWVKGAIVLVVLLGLTWLLGVMYLNEESKVVAYFFTILNSLQGLFIFVFHCLKNEKVQKEYRKVARRTSWLPNCIRVNYGGYSGVVSSSPNGSSGSGNYLSKLFGQRKRKRSVPSTNSSAKPFLSKDQQRRQSDTENCSSRNSSNVPVSLNGYVYNPDGNSVNGYVKSAFIDNGKSTLKPLTNGHTAVAPCYETVDGMAGELSEYVDCSVVDSEFVSEYCKQNMQVNSEKRRYSTGSEDSDVVKPQNALDVDNLSTLSLASSSKKPASFVSTSEIADRSDEDRLDDDVSEHVYEEPLDPRLNLQQYIIPTSKKKKNNNNNLKVENIEENENKKSQRADRSSSMNKLTKPALSLSSIPETETSPQHSSTPNLLFKQGFTDSSLGGSVGDCPNYPAPDYPPPVLNIPVSKNESNSDGDSPSSVKSSLPNLNVDGLTIECEDGPNPECLKRRHSSEADLQFSPFKFTTTDC